jgi:2-polyprenyl-3-methyl-5-hydroxy-6-metoxy-1,4-benzoquinol methylase
VSRDSARLDSRRVVWLLGAVFIAHRYEQARLRKLAALASGSEILDLGCSQYMNPDLVQSGRTVTGLDMNQPKGDVRYDRFLVGDVFELGKLDDGRRYDTIVAGEFIEHVERPYDLLRTLRECLKPGGRLLLSTPNPMSPPVLMFEWALSHRRFYSEDHTYYFAPRWVERMLERTGFQVKDVKGIGLWPLGVPCPVGLSYQVIYVAE